eukprot:TRINITY_DN3984_c0_g1_i5.p1 TRINITY_DN3984_c0_g1~~TRINITY_DN3984_c0_g1_i5.p1  ORF type:complete len:423 (+),score=102.02 TRINITY_DN3984_c0_g1_i5:85-1269(+)
MAAHEGGEEIVQRVAALEASAAVVGGPSAPGASVEDRISRLEAHLVKACDTIARLESLQQQPRQRRSTSRQATSGGGRAPRQPLRRSLSRPVGQRDSGYHFFNSFGVPSNAQGPGGPTPHSGHVNHRRRHFASNHAEMLGSHLATSQGWGGLGAGHGGCVDAHERDAAAGAPSAKELRDRMRKHQHVSPRPQRAMDDSSAVLSPHSQRRLQQEKHAGARSIDKGDAELVGGRSKKLRPRAPRGESEAAPSVHSFTVDMFSQRDLAERKSRGHIMHEAWGDNRPTHDKTMQEASKNESGLHTSWAALQRSKNHHGAEMMATDGWHGDGRHLASPPHSHQRMRAQINQHTAPPRPAECDRLSPQRSRVDAQPHTMRHYSHREQRAAIRHHQYAIAR